MNYQIEQSKRSAAGMAKATSGRSRIFKNKKKYTRKEKLKANQNLD